jgi:hypothetical protein
MIDIKEVMTGAHEHATKSGFYNDGIPLLGLQIALM